MTGTLNQSIGDTRTSEELCDTCPDCESIVGMHADKDVYFKVGYMSQELRHVAAELNQSKLRKADLGALRDSVIDTLKKLGE